MGPPAINSPSRRRAPALAAAACALTLALTGCGNGDEKARARFGAAASTICAQANRTAAAFAKDIAEAQRGSDPAAVYRDLARLTRQRAAAARRALDQLDALVPPADEDGDVDRWLAQQRRRQELLDALAGAFADRADARISTLSQRIDASNSASTAFAARHRLGACARTVA